MITGILLIIMVLNLSSDLPLLSPIRQSDFKYISSPFGWRTHPLHGDTRFHHGIDIATKTKDASIFATADGFIRKVNKKETLNEGLSVLIQHQYSFQTKYAHLSKIYVEEGQVIKAGECIGVIGDTGQTTGRHLHYEIRYEGGAINPMLFWKEVRK